jgi:hypothetical protein
MARSLERFPFFVGCERSGTTLVRAMIDSHPDIAIPPESYFVAQLARGRKEYEIDGVFNWRRFARDLEANQWFQAWGVTEEQLRDGLETLQPESYPDAIRCVFGLYALAHEKGRYGDKTPWYVTKTELLSALFRESCFIHIVRDGRDTALSLIQRTGPPDTLEQAAVFWRERVMAGRRAGERLGPARYREINYERLIDDPRGVLAELCDFIELPYDESMLRYGRIVDSAIGGFPYPEEHQNLRKPPTKGLRDWRTQMSSRNVAVFEALAGDALEINGYPLTASSMPVGTRWYARSRGLSVAVSRLTRRLHRRIRQSRGRLRKQ